MAILPDFGPARQNAAYRRLLAGDLLSTLGSSMTSFALVLQIWDLSRSSLDVGLLGLTFVPVLIVGLLLRHRRADRVHGPGLYPLSCRGSVCDRACPGGLRTGVRRRFPAATAPGRRAS